MIVINSGRRGKWFIATGWWHVRASKSLAIEGRGISSRLVIKTRQSCPVGRNGTLVIKHGGKMFKYRAADFESAASLSRRIEGR